MPASQPHQPTNRLHGVMPEETSGGAGEVIAERPFSASMLAFGAGLGVGLALAYLLTDSSHKRHANMAQRLGRQVLDAVSSVVPSQLRH